MPTITTKDGAQIFYKDWGDGQPVVFSHGWPLNADAWDEQLFFLAEQGYRTVAHDRRGHGRSSQTWSGNDMDTYADDLGAVIEALGLRDVILVGHSTGGGEVTRYIGRHGTSRVAKVVLVGAIPPLMLKTEANPGGLPRSVFDGIRSGVLSDRSQFYKDLSLPFYGGNREGSKLSQGLRDQFWLQSMQVGIKGAHDCVAVFSETDLTEDLKKIRRADAVHPRRRRSDRAYRRCRQDSVENRQGRHAEDLSRRRPWPDRHGKRQVQRRSARFHQGLTGKAGGPDGRRPY